MNKNAPKINEQTRTDREVAGNETIEDLLRKRGFFDMSQDQKSQPIFGRNLGHNYVQKWGIVFGAAPRADIKQATAGDVIPLCCNELHAGTRGCHTPAKSA